MKLPVPRLSVASRAPALHRLLSLFGFLAITAAAHGQGFSMSGGVTLKTVPLGQRATLNGGPISTLDALPYGVSLSNGTAGRSGSTGGGLTTLTSSVGTGNLSNEPTLDGGASTSLIVRDQWTVSGASRTGSPRIQIDIELTGSVTASGVLYNPSVAQQSFDAIADVEIRLNNGSPTSLRYSLRDVVAAGGSTPRTISGTFPFSRTGSIRLTLPAATAFSTRIDHYAVVSFNSPSSAGTPPTDEETFRPVSGFGSLQMQAQARITKLSIIPPDFGTGSITSPVIASASGYDYNPLLNGPAASTQLRILSVSRTATSFTVQWDSSAGHPSFSAYATSDLGLPREQWTRVAQGIPNAGATTTFTESGIGSIPRRFYRIESE